MCPTPIPHALNMTQRRSSQAITRELYYSTAHCATACLQVCTAVGYMPPVHACMSTFSGEDGRSALDRACARGSSGPLSTAALFCSPGRPAPWLDGFGAQPTRAGGGGWAVRGSGTSGIRRTRGSGLTWSTARVCGGGRAAPGRVLLGGRGAGQCISAGVLAAAGGAMLEQAHPGRAAAAPAGCCDTVAEAAGRAVGRAGAGGGGQEDGGVGGHAGPRDLGSGGVAARHLAGLRRA